MLDCLSFRNQQYDPESSCLLLSYHYHCSMKWASRCAFHDQRFRDSHPSALRSYICVARGGHKRRAYCILRKPPVLLCRLCPGASCLTTETNAGCFCNNISMSQHAHWTIEEHAMRAEVLNQNGYGYFCI